MQGWIRWAFVAAVFLLVPAAAEAALAGQGLTINISNHQAGQSSTDTSLIAGWNAVTNPNGTVYYYFVVDHYAAGSTGLTRQYMINAVNDPYALTGGPKYTGTSITGTTLTLPDGEWFLHVMAVDGDGPTAGTDIYTAPSGGRGFIVDTAPVITSFTPAQAAHQNTQTMTVNGRNFITGLTASLYNSTVGTVALTVRSGSVDAYGQSFIVDVPALTPGKYDLKVINGGASKKAATAAQQYSAINNPPTPKAGIANSTATATAADSYSIVMTGTSLNIALDATGTVDPDGDAIKSYSWTTTTKPTGSNVASAASGQQATVVVDKVGSYAFTLIVTDIYGAAASSTVNLTVTQPGAGSPPVADLYVTPAIVVPGGSVLLDASNTVDNYSAAAWYQYSKSSGPAAMALPADAYGNNRATFTAPTTAGTYVIKLTVTNPYGSSSASASLVVNHTPYADAGSNFTGSVGATITLDGSGSTDADGQPLTYTWTPISTYAQAVGTLTGAKPTFTPTRTGDYTFSLVVNDGLADSTNTAQVTVTVVNGFTITHKYLPGLNLIAWPISTSSITTAAALAAAIEAKGMVVNQVFGWTSGASQGYSTPYAIVRDQNGNVLLKTGDFSLVAGGAYFVELASNSASGSLSVTGQAYSAVSVANGLNLVSVPLTNSSLVSASQWVQDMESKLGVSINQVFGWTSGAQPGFSTPYAIVRDNQGTVLLKTGDFTLNSVNPAMGYFVEIGTAFQGTKSYKP